MSRLGRVSWILSINERNAKMLPKEKLMLGGVIFIGMKELIHGAKPFVVCRRSSKLPYMH